MRKKSVRTRSLAHTNSSLVKLRFKLKRRQVKMIKRFAQMMKWPNLAETLAALRQGDQAASLDAVSSHAMAFFSGLVLPGVRIDTHSQHSTYLPTLTSSSPPSPLS